MKAEPGAGHVDLKRYLPHVVVVTTLVAAAPVWVAVWLARGHPLGSIVLSTALALALARLGAFLWQRFGASEDLVFDDLFAWGFLRRLRAQRAVLTSTRRLGLLRDDSTDAALSREERERQFKRLASALERGDPYTHGHSQRVARHSYMVAKTMHLSRRQREKVRLAGLLHDLGKLNVPRDVLNKPGRLSEVEFAAVKTHPGVGADMVAMLRDAELTAMIRYHHERIDGTGYPHRLEGDEIPIGARIIAVADTFDAITSRRPYRPARKHKVAMQILREEAGTQLDAEVVRAFEVYYSGRRSLRWWFMFLAGFRQGIEALALAFQRWGFAGVANAAAVGSVAVAVAGGAAIQGQLPEKAQPHERQAIVREAKEGGDKPVGLRAIASEASDGTATESAGEAVTQAQARTRSRSSQRSQPDQQPGNAQSDNAFASADSPGKGDTKAANKADDNATVAADSTQEEPAQAKQAAKPAEDRGPAEEVVDKVKDVAGTVPGSGGNGGP